jgi:F0F1-type ATP synthase membrane subunit a
VAGQAGEEEAAAVKNPKALLIALGAMALIGVGFFFVRGPKPIIEIKGEKVAELGPLPLLNTLITAFTVSLIIILLTWLATRRMNIIPRGLQNAFEAVAEALYNMCVQFAGEKNARRFFPVAATIFVFIWIANWMALTPIFNSFGAVQDVNAHHFHDEANILDDKGGIGFIFPYALGGDSPLVELKIEQGEGDAKEEFEAEEAVTSQCGGLVSEDHKHCEEGVHSLAIAHALEGRDYETNLGECPLLAPDAPELEAGAPKREVTAEQAERWDCWEHAGELGISNLEADGKKLGVIFPYFRSMNTDLNTPLSLAIMSVIFIEFWGITGLGFFKYGSKFINFSSPIGFFVGLLELVAEVARIISFTFRLFGNMIAGEILLLVMTFLIPFLVALPFYGLEVFVGAVQAFVFFALTIAFGALAVASHDEHGEPHESHAEPAEEHGIIHGPASEPV